MSEFVPGNVTVTGTMTVKFFDEKLVRELTYSGSAQMTRYYLWYMRPRVSKRAWRRLRGKMLSRLKRR